MQTLLDKDVDKLVFRPPELGCVLYLPGLPGGGNKIYDRSPYGNHGTITGATWERLPSGLWFLSFDGIDDEVDCGSASNMKLARFTWKIWVYLDSLSQDAVVINQDANGGAGDIAIGVYNSADEILLGIAGNLKGLNGISSHLTAQIWQQWILTYDSGTIGFFLNGVAKTLGAVNNMFTPQGSSLKLGARGAPNQRWLAGDLALYEKINEVWTSIQASNSFNREKHLFGVW